MEAEQRQVAKHYGTDAQLNQLIEECGELITAIAKIKRQAWTEPGVEQVNRMAEEMADVENVLEQIKLLIPEIRKVVADYKRAKIKRQIFRIELEKERASK